jgi:DNA-binding MarR family transcriptional regulator
MDETSHSEHESIGAWVKRCYFAGRALMEATLRPYGIGSTQWYVLWHLAHSGPTMQRDLVAALDVERATLSGIVTTLVGKGLICQVADDRDQRQRRLKLTPDGQRLWDELPDLTFIHNAAFDGIDDDAVAAAIAVLKTATARLNGLIGKGDPA